MNEQNENGQSEKYFFWRLLEILLKWRRVLLTNMLVAAVLTLIIMLFIPNKYTATTSILPPEEDSGSLGLAASLLPSGLSSLLGGSGMSLPGLATPSDLYAAILKSRSVSQEIIRQYDLMTVFKEHIEEKAIGELQARTSIAVEPEGIISLGYEDTDPKRAAAIANSYMEVLNKINRENGNARARELREFVEQRLNETIRDLTLAEEAYKNFQEKNFTVALDEQVKALISAMADLRGQKVLAEIELGIMKKTLSPSNTRYVEQEYKIEQIQEQLNKLERGDTTKGKESILDLQAKETPELALELARLTRDLKIQETIFELLKQQYEQAKIQELKDTPTIQILDRAEVPRIKSRPKRVTIAAMGGIASFFMTMIFVIFLEFLRKEKERNSVTYKRIQDISTMLNDDLIWMRSIFSRRRNNVN